MHSEDLFRIKLHLGEFLAEKIITLTAFLSFAMIILIFVFVFRESLPLFGIGAEEAQTTLQPEEQMETYGEEALDDASRAAESAVHQEVPAEQGEEKATLGNLLGTEWQPVSGRPKFGLWPLFAGSLKVSLIAILLAAPIAILAALFTSTFASRRWKEFLKPAIEVLAGFPSVVIGFFALIVLASLVQDTIGSMFRLNALVGGIALSLAVIPIVYTIAEDAIASVPKSMTEASLALGATPWQSALFVTLPAATPGIFAAILLGVGRAFGETMIVLMATGNAALMTWSPVDPVRTMSATIGAEMAEVVFGDTHYNVLFLIGSLLFLFTFTLNVVAEFYIRRRLLKKFGSS